MNGEIVELATPVPGLVTFDCAHAQPLAALDLYQRLSRELTQSSLELTGLEENELGEWTLTFSSGPPVKLGRDDHRARLRRFLAVYDAELGERAAQVAAVDARYANGVAVRWRGSESEALAQVAGVPTTVPGPLTRAEHGFR
jgi:cell division protein FtsQ